MHESMFYLATLEAHQMKWKVPIIGLSLSATAAAGKITIYSHCMGCGNEVWDMV